MSAVRPERSFNGSGKQSSERLLAGSRTHKTRLMWAVVKSRGLEPVVFVTECRQAASFQWSMIWRRRVLALAPVLFHELRAAGGASVP